MASVKIENPADFRRVAAEHGVQCSTGKGRLPARDLFTVLNAKGVTIDPTAYFGADGKIHRQETATPSASYAVSARTPRRDASGNVKLNGKGEVVFGSARKTTITPEQVRKLTDAGTRGRLSDSNTVRAAAEYAGWLSGDELADVSGHLKDATVTRVETPAVKPAAKAKAAKATKPAAVEPVDVVVEPVPDLDAIAA